MTNSCTNDTGYQSSRNLIRQKGFQSNSNREIELNNNIL